MLNVVISFRCTESRKPSCPPKFRPDRCSDWEGRRTPEFGPVRGRSEKYRRPCRSRPRFFLARKRDFRAGGVRAQGAAIKSRVRLPGDAMISRPPGSSGT